MAPRTPGKRTGGGHRRLPLPSMARALRLTALSALLPGTGHLASGRRHAGRLMLGSFGLLLAAGALLAVAVPHSTLVRLAVQPDSLELAMAGGAALALIWMLIVFSSWVVTRPAHLNSAQKAVGGAVVLAMGLAVATPFALGVRTVYVQHDLITDVFADAPPRVGPGVTPGDPAGPVLPLGEAADVLAGKERVNILLLGGDGGPNRDGVRTDTMIMASIDAATGRTVLVSLPRNLESVPFEPGTPMAEAFPDGYTDLLNSVYGYAEDNPAMVPGARHPGGELLKATVAHAIGQEIDYFVLVNLQGFRKIVDAFGGVTVNVTTRLPIGGSTDAQGRTITPPTSYLEPGVRKLDGYEALWYSRSRYGADDYQRMARQRCVLGAIADQANPMKVLLNFRKLASTAKEVILTDIPQSALPELLDLAERGKGALVTSVTFVRSATFSPADPDYDLIRERVLEALDESVTAADPPAAGITPTPVATPPGTAKAPKAGAPAKAGGTAKAPKAGASAKPAPTPTPTPSVAAALTDVCSS